MSEETEVTVETPEVTTEEAPRSKLDAGYDPVDIDTASPEEIKTRLNYLYKQAKTGQKTQSELREVRELAAKQDQVIRDLQNGMYQVADHLQNKTFAETETTLRAQMQSAYEAGDYMALTTAQEKLMDLKVQKTANQSKPRQQEVQIPRLNQVANQAYEDGEISFEDKAMTSAWIDERNESGEPLRPWAINHNPNDPDPDYVKALMIAQRIFNDPSKTHLPFAQKLAEVDKKMGTRKPASHQTVMNGGLNIKGRTAKLTLTPEAERIAVRTRFGGPNAKTDAEHIEAYAKYTQQMAKHKIGKK